MTGPSVRWSEHGPIPAPADGPDAEGFVGPTEVAAAAVEPTPPGAEGLAPGDDIAVLRARLAERGLVRQEPAVRIRETAGDAPRPVPEPLPPAAEASVPVMVPDDAEELEPEPAGPTVETRCPSCRSSQQVSTGAAGYRCVSCTKAWRWAICTHCAELSLTLARQESWRCTPCGDYSRSWWRTIDGRSEAPNVVLRRQSDEARRQREATYERARKRRWKIVLVGTLLIGATGAWAVGFSDRGVPATEKGPTGAVCSTAAELSATFSSPGTAPGEVRESLDALARAATEAIPEVEVAAQQWAASGLPGDETFAAAERQLRAACTSA